MQDSAFIGRDEELEALLDVVRHAAEGRGSVGLVEAAAGGGKTALVDQLLDRLADGAIPLVRVARGDCFNDSSPENAFQPFAQALVALLQSSDRRGRRVTRKLAQELMKIAPELMRLIPVVGPIADPVTRTTIATWQWLAAGEPDELASRAQTLQGNFVTAFLEATKKYGPILILIEDAHWCDRSSAELLHRLSRTIRQVPFAVIVTYRSAEALEESPLKPVVAEMLRDHVAQLVRLKDFTGAELHALVSSRYGSDVADRLSPWLLEHFGGNPLLLSSYLSLLESRGQLGRETPDGHWALVTALEDLPVPESIEAVLDERVKRLSDAERRMMRLASVQGHEFLATVLATQLATSEDSLLESLTEVEQSAGVITPGEPEVWAREWSDSFRFAHELMRLAFYRHLTPRQRVRYHEAVGSALAARLQATARPDRRFILETARHLRLGERWEEAAQHYRRAARSSYLEGALSEATSSAERALDCIDQMEDATDSKTSLLTAKVIQLLLLSSPLAWWHAPETLAGRPFMDVVEAGVAAAGRTADQRLAAQLVFLKGKATLITGSLAAAIEIFADAVERCRAAGDDLGEVIGLTELGHATVGLDLEEGLRLQVRAHALLKELLSRVDAARVDEPGLSRHRHRLEATIGAAYFDQGSMDEADQWLRWSFEGLRRHRMPDLVSTITNLHAQLLMATGRFEEAEELLVEALASPDGLEDVVVQRGYLNALLGKLYLEWERPRDAVRPLSEAWTGTRGSINTAVMPLIANYYAELLLSAESGVQDHVEARQILEQNLEQTVSSGFRRSEVASLMWLGRLDLDQHQRHEALEVSTRAVKMLEASGPLPALRTEEVLFTHHQCLTAAGDLADAKRFLELAYDEVMRKADHLRDPAARERFLARVPLSRRIVEAHRGTA